MAKQTAGYLGGFNGKLGPAIGYRWRGVWCMRSYNRHPANPRTPKQVAHREMFKQEVQLAATMRWAINQSFRDISYEMGMTPYNLFVHLNQHAFSLNEGAFVVDYSALRLSVGPLAEAEYGAPVWTADNVLTVHFERGGGKSNDYVRLYVYCPEKETGILTAPVYRNKKIISAMLPDMFAGCEVHVYGLVSNEKGMWADTTYIGRVVCDELNNNVLETGEEVGDANATIQDLSSVAPSPAPQGQGRAADGAPDGPPSPQ